MCSTKQRPFARKHSEGALEQVGSRRTNRPSAGRASRVNPNPNAAQIRRTTPINDVAIWPAADCPFRTDRVSLRDEHYKDPCPQGILLASGTDARPKATQRGRLSSSLLTNTAVRLYLSGIDPNPPSILRDCLPPSSVGEGGNRALRPDGR